MILKKVIFFIIFMNSCLFFYSQKAYDFNNDEMKNTLKTETLKVVLTGDNDFDARLKSAFNFYWNVSKFEFISSAQYNKMEAGKDYKTVFMFGDFDVKGYNLSFSKFVLMVQSKKNALFKMIDLGFDNMKDTKSGEEMGADKTKDAILNKISPYVMLINSQLKKQMEMGNMRYAGYKGDKELIKDRKIFIQEDYFLNNLDPALLSKLNFKVEIPNSKKIKSVLEDKKSQEGYAWLCFVTDPRSISAFIIDLKTGELLDYASIDKAETPKKELNEKIFTKLLKQLNDK